MNDELLVPFSNVSINAEYFMCKGKNSYNIVGVLSLFGVFIFKNIHKIWEKKRNTTNSVTWFRKFIFVAIGYSIQFSDLSRRELKSAVLSQSPISE